MTSEQLGRRASLVIIPFLIFKLCRTASPAADGLATTSGRRLDPVGDMLLAVPHVDSLIVNQRKKEALYRGSLLAISNGYK